MADYTLKDLEYWDQRIREKVEEFGLSCYPQEFEICDHADMNEGAAGLTSLSALRAVGQPADRVFRRNPWLAELLANTRTTRARNVRADLSLQGEGRKGLPVRGAATVLVNAEGTEVGTLLTLHDLSYQRALESRSRETERLRQLEILLAGLAHEIKNPLSGMDSHS